MNAAADLAASIHRPCAPFVTVSSPRASFLRVIDVRILLPVWIVVRAGSQMKTVMVRYKTSSAAHAATNEALASVDTQNRPLMDT